MNDVLEVMNALNNIDYGFISIDGERIIGENNKWDDFSKLYFLQEPKEVLNSKCGVCWDQVEVERYLLNAKNIDVNSYFIYIDDYKELPSHTFLTFNYNNKVYWFEHSWYSYKGIHEYKDINELLVDVKNKFVESQKDNYRDEYQIYLYKYDTPKFHISCDVMYNYIKTQERINIL